ncbi:MAG: hypothetical protein KKF02_04665 [Proteobacteria bacterium]|nr:hypothetical protein [Pseudomonadota bacterium]
MHELPEVETLCRQLSAVIPDKKIIRIDVLDPLLGKGEGLAGRRVAAVARRGKTIEIRMDGRSRSRPVGEPEDRRRKGRRRERDGGTGDVLRPERRRESGDNGGMDEATVALTSG